MEIDPRSWRLENVSVSWVGWDDVGDIEVKPMLLNIAFSVPKSFTSGVIDLWKRNRLVFDPEAKFRREFTCEMLMCR